MEIATKEDLATWKKQLLDEIKKLLKPIESKPQTQWIKSKEVRELLQCSPGTLQTLKNKLNHAKINGTIYWNYNSINEMLEQSSSLNTNTL